MSNREKFARKMVDSYEEQLLVFFAVEYHLERLNKLSDKDFELEKLEWTDE